MVWLKGAEEATYCVIDTVLSNEDTVGLIQRTIKVILCHSICYVKGNSLPKF